MNRYLHSSVVLSLILSGLVPFASAASASGRLDPQAGKIADRAVRIAAEVQKYDGEGTSTYRTVDSGGRVVQSSRYRMVTSYRAPGVVWTEFRGDDGTVTLQFADGVTEFYFSSKRPERINQRSLDGLSSVRRPEYPELEFNFLSPARLQVYHLAIAKPSAVRSDHLGQELLDGVLCEVIEFVVPVSDKVWAAARAANPSLPTKGERAERFWVGVEDCMVRRMTSTEETPGVSTTWIERNYRVCAPDTALQVTYERFAAKVKGVLGERPFPQVESIFNEAGKSLPKVIAQKADGTPLHWSDYSGKVLVVETFASWCTFCKAAMPYYEKMRAKLAGQGVVFIALDFDQKKEDYDKWLAANREKYGFVFARVDVDPTDYRKTLAEFKGSLPAFYVVGGDGKIVTAYSGFGYGVGADDPRLFEALKKAGVELPP